MPKKELPESEDREFWGEDAEQFRTDLSGAEKVTVNEAHEWRQQGPFLICKSCPFPHSVHIGMGKELVGLDEKGKPIIKKVVDRRKS